MRARVGAKTDVGQVRDANEDSYLVEDPLFVVADGMGGHLAGDVASQTAVETIERRAGEASGQDPQSLSALVRAANAAIFERATDDPTLHGMGTTCTLALLDAQKVHFAHVGDSRAYLFRAGSLDQLTEDHTLVGRMVREGRLQPEEAENHPQRSIITRALGVDDHVDVDLFTIDVHEGDRILLCSDGLTSMVDGGAIADVLADESDPQEAADRLVELANRGGGEDNITVLVIDLGDDAATGGGSAAASRQSTQPDDAVSDDVIAPRWRLRSRLAVAVGIAIVVLGALTAAGKVVLANSWYVGVNDSGEVAIFKGRPETIAGLDLGDEYRTSRVALNDLPSFVRDDLRQGLPAESLEDAQSKVSDLENLAEDRDFRRSQDRDARAGKSP